MEPSGTEISGGRREPLKDLEQVRRESLRGWEDPWGRYTGEGSNPDGPELGHWLDRKGAGKGKSQGLPGSGIVPRAVCLVRLSLLKPSPGSSLQAAGELFPSPLPL